MGQLGNGFIGSSDEFQIEFANSLLGVADLTVESLTLTGDATSIVPGDTINLNLGIQNLGT